MTRQRFHSAVAYVLICLPLFYLSIAHLQRIVSDWLSFSPDRSIILAVNTLLAAVVLVLAVKYLRVFFRLKRTGDPFLHYYYLYILTLSIIPVVIAPSFFFITAFFTKPALSRQFLGASYTPSVLLSMILPAILLTMAIVYIFGVEHRPSVHHERAASIKLIMISFLAGGLAYFTANIAAEWILDLHFTYLIAWVSAAAVYLVYRFGLVKLPANSRLDPLALAAMQAVLTGLLLYNFSIHLLWQYR